MKFLTILNNIFDFLFPPPQEVALLQKLSLSQARKLLPACPPLSSHTAAVFIYRNPLVRTLIWQLKYTGNKKIARLCGEILYDAIQKQIRSIEKNHTPYKLMEKILLIPVPLNGKRQRERGFNQNERVAQETIRSARKNKDLRLDYIPYVLMKTKDTFPQSSLKQKSQRLYNLCDCFDVREKATIRGKIIFLIDDIVTTGSTFKECKKTLLSAGALDVYCIAIAH